VLLPLLLPLLLATTSAAVALAQITAAHAADAMQLPVLLQRICS
jgi:hypothetical protein